MKLFLVFLVSLPLLDASSDINLLKSQMQKLQTEVTNEKAEIKQLKSRVQTRNGICQINSNRCGSCLCVEDYSLVNDAYYLLPVNYFCDCREKPVRRDCKEHYAQGERINGLYRVSMNIIGHVVQVSCVQNHHHGYGGGWTVVQRRFDGSENFYRSWQEYKHGFGKLQGEHWLGNENLYRLTAQAIVSGSELFVGMMKKSSGWSYMRYTNFDIGRESTGYKLHVSGRQGGSYSGMEKHDGMKFSTYDKDQDPNTSVDCASEMHGAWWYDDCKSTSSRYKSSNLNGAYDEFENLTDAKAAFSFYGSAYRLRSSLMMVRRK
ncbi:microfibril-associated glycoprotein 4-like [Clytia hemisphaerica]|uniref:Fibrinogen C-terminal domain-containing protein n=1 Tax=Clytia hemisphaerica TaxID=252671 RepID=A0A7M5U4C3_9CNID